MDTATEQKIKDAAGFIVETLERITKATPPDATTAPADALAYWEQQAVHLALATSCLCPPPGASAANLEPQRIDAALNYMRAISAAGAHITAGIAEAVRQGEAMMAMAAMPTHGNA